VNWIARMMGLSLCLGVLPALATADNAYPPEAVATFMTDCQSKFAKQAPPGFGDRGDRYCTCLINRLQATMPYEQFRQLAPDEEPPELKAATQECISAIF